MKIKLDENIGGRGLDFLLNAAHATPGYVKKEPGRYRQGPSPEP